MIFQCMQNNSDYIIFKMHLLTSEVPMSILSKETAVLQVQYPESKYNMNDNII